MSHPQCMAQEQSGTIRASRFRITMRPIDHLVPYVVGIALRTSLAMKVASTVIYLVLGFLLGIAAQSLVFWLLGWLFF
jgi:hypothetical protein